MNRYLICAALLGGLVCVSTAKDGAQLEEAYRINSETEAKIQTQVLDRMLGAGKASVFLEMKAEVKATVEESSKEGTGEVRTKLPDSGEKGPAPAADNKGSDADKKQEQSARQTKGTVDKKDAIKFTIGAMKMRILHDSAIPAAKIGAVKDALLALYPEKLKAEDIVFIPAAFESRPAPEQKQEKERSNGRKYR